MNDLYAINAAKTEVRDAYNRGDPEALINVLDAEAVYVPDQQPLAIGSSVADAIRKHFAELFAKYDVHLDPIIIEIRVRGEVACEYGWHEWRFTPRESGAPFTRKDRYVDVWKKNASGQWKLWTYMENVDVPMKMPTAV